MSNSTCKGCDSRKSGCHATCEKYIAWKIVHDAMNAEKNRQKAVQDGLNQHLVDTMRKNKKRMGIQKPSISGGQ